MPSSRLLAAEGWSCERRSRSALFQCIPAILCASIYIFHVIRRDLLPFAACRRSTRSPVILFALLCAGLVCLSAGPVRADDALLAAKKRYESGEREYLAGRFWQSAKSFEEAYALSRRSDLLFNAARAYDRGEYAVRAIEAYQAYLDAMPDAPDKPQIQKRIGELRATLAKLFIATQAKGFLFIDGHEYGSTPMQQPMDMDSGYHRVEVRQGNLSWAKEQQFSSGQLYNFNAELAAVPGGRGLADTTAAGEEQRPKQRTRRMAVSVGIGGALDVSGTNFPPHQAALYLGADYRTLERAFFALDLVLRIPMEFGQAWRNAGFLIGGRGTLSPAPRLPLELVLELDLGLGVLDYNANAPPQTVTNCARHAGVPGLASCTLYGLRLHPKLGLAYRVTSAIELRGELLGIEIDFTNPLAYPRVTVNAAAAYRFF